jgi:hypothetical protein
MITIKPGKFTEVCGNVSKPEVKHKQCAVIAHCCNDVGIMNSGVALGLRLRWPTIKMIYLSNTRLGQTSFAWVEDEGSLIKVPRIIVANMIGQHCLTKHKGRAPIRYIALAHAMERVAENIMGLQLTYPNIKFSIHIPRIGSRRAGGNFDFVMELVQEAWLDRGLDVILYEYNERGD